MAAPKKKPAPPTAARAAATIAPVKVRVINTKGFAGDPPRLRRIGDVFTISGERWPEGHAKAGQIKAFSDKWMELVDPATPEVSISPADAARAAERQMNAGTARMDIHGSVIPDPAEDDRDEDDHVPTGAREVLG